MAIKNAHLRPHCVDLAPSVFNSNEKRTEPHKSKRPVANKDKQRVLATRQSSPPTGAVRKGAETTSGGIKHTGKLICAAVVVITGAAIWTPGSSETNLPFESASTDSQAHNQTVNAAFTAPSFFFDDESDALQRTIKQPEALVTTYPLTGNEEPAPALANSVDTSVQTPEWDKDTSVAMTTEPVNPVLPTLGNFSATTPEPIIRHQEPATGPIETDTTDTTGTQGNIVRPDLQAPAVTADSAEVNAPQNELTTKQVIVKSGDTLSQILNRNGLQASQMRELLADELLKKHLSGIEVGQLIELTYDESDEFKSLTTRVGEDKRVNIERSGSIFQVTAIELPTQTKRMVTSGRIEQSLYLSAQKANLEQRTIMELANIFQWELDFVRDIRDGDKFSLVYEQLYREGEYVKDGNILAAEFVRGGKHYRAIRFTTDDGNSGYYSPDGQSKRRTFTRHPVDVVRITSKFNPKRLHPVLHKIRAHRGVDYGSPHGSPIYATADGRVTYSGPKNAYGNTVMLKHGEKFSTLYAHMSRISDKSKVGKRVKQGDVIGYVGKTGRVTGTHLHYEFRVNGEQIDPLKVELPAAAPLEEKYLPQLEQLSSEFSGLMSASLTDLNSQVATATDNLDVLTPSHQSRWAR